MQINVRAVEGRNSLIDPTFVDEYQARLDQFEVFYHDEDKQRIVMVNFPMSVSTSPIEGQKITIGRHRFVVRSVNQDWSEVHFPQVNVTIAYDYSTRLV